MTDAALAIGAAAIAYVVVAGLLRLRKSQKEMNMSDLTTKIIEYEAGQLDEQQTIELFQRLVDSGMAWKLQGHYGRTAARLIEAGLVKQKETA